MADFDAQLPVRTIATEFTTEVANASGTTINPAEDYAQGSTTVGENGVLAQGAVTTAAPVYVTGQTNPLSLDTSGNLRVTVSNTSGTAPILTYFTDAAVASTATVTHSLAGPCVLDHVHGAGSGEIKMTVAIGITGSEVTYWNGFTSASNQNCEFDIADGYIVPTGSSVKITLKNRDIAAQDLYLTFQSH